MITTEVEHTGWDAQRIKERLGYYPESQGKEQWVQSILEQIYADRVQSDETPSLDEFASFGIPVEQLQLCAEDDDLPLGFAVGRRFRLEQRIGRGSFGIVYRGTDLLQKSPVAVKVSRGKDGQSKLQAKELLRHEANALRNLSNPHIPRFIDLVSEGDLTLCMVFEFVSGRRLHDIVKLGPIAPQKVASISAAIAGALDFAHRRGYVHRDLSTGNVLIDDADHPYLLDFGLALSDESRFDTDQQIGGTFTFMPVENFSGETHSIDGRSDIWALGALMYAMLWGRSNPYNLQRETAMFGAVLLGRGGLKFPVDVPAELAAICEKCLSADPNDRFNTAGHLADTLHEFLGFSENDPEKKAIRTDGNSLRLTAWRAGIALGGADRDQSTAGAWVRHANSVERTARESIRRAMSTALRYELEAIEGFHATAWLAGTLGITLEPVLWFHSQCTAAYSEGGVALEEAKSWLPMMMDEIGPPLEDAFLLLKTYFESRDGATAALFGFAMFAALRVRREDMPSLLSGLALKSGLQYDLWSSFVAATSAESEIESLQREFHRLDKRVERELSYLT